jgi:hypothetical protein
VQHIRPRVCCMSCHQTHHGGLSASELASGMRMNKICRPNLLSQGHQACYLIDKTAKGNRDGLIVPSNQFIHHAQVFLPLAVVAVLPQRSNRSNLSGRWYCRFRSSLGVDLRPTNVLSAYRMAVTSRRGTPYYIPSKNIPSLQRAFGNTAANRAVSYN